VTFADACDISLEDEFNPSSDQLASMCGTGTCADSFANVITGCADDPSFSGLSGDCEDILAALVEEDSSEDNQGLGEIDFSSCAVGNCTSSCTSEPSTCAELDEMTSRDGCAASCLPCVKELMSDSEHGLDCGYKAPPPPPPIKVTMKAAGSVDDYDDEVKTGIAEGVQQTMQESSGVTVPLADITVTVTAARRRLEVALPSTRRLSEDGVVINVEIETESVPEIASGAVEVADIAEALEDPATQTLMTANIAASAGVTVTEISVTVVVAKKETNMAGIIGGAAGGALCGIGIMAGAYQMMKKKKVKTTTVG